MDDPTPSELSGEELVEAVAQAIHAKTGHNNWHGQRTKRSYWRRRARTFLAARNQAPTPSGEGFSDPKDHALTAAGEMELRQAVERVRERADWFAIDAHGHIGQEAREQLATDLRTILAALALPPAGIEGSEPVAWRYAYVHPGKSLHWKVRQTPIASQPASSGLVEIIAQALGVIPPQDHGQVSAQDGSALERGTAGGGEG